MSSISMTTIPKTENVKVNEKHPVSGEQEESSKKAAQDALKQLQIVLVGLGGHYRGVGTEVLGNALLKAEEILLQESLASDIDPETQKTLEDLAQLVGSTKNFTRERNIGDRVQRIAQETKLALQEVGNTGGSSPREAQQMLQIIKKWRPLFQLLMSSREFRILIQDSLKILRRVYLRPGFSEIIGDSIQSKFIEGEYPTDIAKTIPQKIAQNQKNNIRPNFSEEEWSDLRDDITKILVTLAKHPAYHQGIWGLLDMVSLLQSRTPTTTLPHTQRLRMETEKLIASFSGRETLDAFIESLQRLVQRVEHDERFRNFISEFRGFILGAKISENIQEEEFQKRCWKFIEVALEITQEFNYTEDLNLFLDCADQLMENIHNDEFVQVLRHHAGLIANDLSYTDNSGQIQLDMEMVGKLRNILIPILAETLKYIPIPRIESTNNSREYWVDNIVLCGYDVIPSHFRVQLESDSDVTLREIETKCTSTRLIITLSQLRTELKDLDFYYKKKTFPVISDSGKMNLRLGGTRGATLILNFKVEQSTSDHIPRLREGSVSFNIEKLDVTFDRSTIDHDVLLPVISQMFKTQIQQNIEMVVEHRLGFLVGSLVEQLSEAVMLVNRPLQSSLEQLQKDVISVCALEKRQEKLE